MNAINFIDGLDGLVAGVALIVFVPRARTETNAALDQLMARPSASAGEASSSPAPAGELDAAAPGGAGQGDRVVEVLLV